MNTLLLRGIAAHYLRRTAIFIAAIFGYSYRDDMQRRLNERHMKIEAEKQRYPILSQIKVQQAHSKAIELE